VFSRILGHFEIPRSQKWVETSECWVCEKHTYSVILVSKTIAKSFFVKPKMKDRNQFLLKIKNAKENQDDTALNNDDDMWGSDNDELYYDADSEDDKHHSFKNNLITGTFSRWKCRSMVPLGEFIRRLDKNS
jgi:hypothetical protein